MKRAMCQKTIESVELSQGTCSIVIKGDVCPEIAEFMFYWPESPEEQYLICGVCRSRMRKLYSERRHLSKPKFKKIKVKTNNESGGSK